MKTLLSGVIIMDLEMNDERIRIFSNGNVSCRNRGLVIFCCEDN